METLQKTTFIDLPNTTTPVDADFLNDLQDNIINNFSETDTRLTSNSSSIGTLSSLTTTEKSNLVGATNEINTKVGNLSNLNTTNKSDLVNAINEVLTKVNNAALNQQYPVGRIVMFYDLNDHSNYLGFTWERCIVGNFPVGYDSSDSDFNTIGKTGGEKEHTLTIDEMPVHTHIQNSHSHDDILDNNDDRITYNTGSTPNYRVIATTQMGNASGSWKMHTSDERATNQNTGGGQAHNNVPPFEVIAYWRRIA